MRNGVFCDVRAEMLQAGQLESWSVSWWVTELANELENC
jgi:hypothetical protein